jgi:hypothetical protein
MAGVRPAGVSDQIEIDLVVRRGNSVGIIEAMTGVKKAGGESYRTTWIRAAPGNTGAETAAAGQQAAV